MVKLTAVSSKKNVSGYVSHYDDMTQKEACLTCLNTLFKASPNIADLRVTNVLHRGVSEERSEEIELDDDVFFDFFSSLKRNLRTTERNKTIGRNNSWDDLARGLRCFWALFVSLLVFGATYLIFTTIPLTDSWVSGKVTPKVFLYQCPSTQRCRWLSA